MTIVVLDEGVITPCNELGQAINDADDLLGGFLRGLGSDYSKFPMCYKSRCKIPEEIERIESLDSSSMQISEVESLAQVLGKEHVGRVRGVGYGPTPTQVFGKKTYQFNGVSSNKLFEIMKLRR
ncbi:uncharacterized protein LOC132060676 [Lycium ferocissimum]|uniref:uncharacterized protein LOC132060676 n=1 Tax=Lycium ferocissimum TaxID=112874 RepID=UPI002815B517|nr:uncharacterized protein LOC132060676 [Lycium ferocissimum]